MRNFLDVFREIMRSPEWRDHFDLTFQPIFDAVGRRLVGQTDTAVPTGRGSKLYELNLYAMTLGRAKQRTVSLEDELAKRAERKAAELARAASKRTFIHQFSAARRQVACGQFQIICYNSFF